MQGRSQARSGVVLAILSAAAFMASLDVFIVNVAFDAIGTDFTGATLSQLSWVLNAYAIGYAALLIPAGRIADRYGRKGGFLLGLAVMGILGLLMVRLPLANAGSPDEPAPPTALL